MIKTNVIIMTTMILKTENNSIQRKSLNKYNNKSIHIMSIITCLGTSRLFWVFISAPVGVRDLVNVVRNRFIIPIA